MSVEAVDAQEVRFVEALRERLTGTGEEDTRVIDVVVDQIEDANGTPAWRLTLVLPVPEEGAWNVTRTRMLKRDGRRAADEVAKRLGMLLDGVTTVTLTTRGADAQDVAPEDRPEPGEAGVALRGEELEP